MQKKKRDAAVPSRDKYPFLGQKPDLKAVLTFYEEVRSWLDERKRFLASLKRSPHYYDEFAAFEENFMGRLLYESTQFGLGQDRDNGMREGWENDLRRAQGIYSKALAYLDRIGYWKKEKNLRPCLKFNKTRKSVTFLDPVNGDEKEQMLNSNTVSAFLCLKVITECRLKRSKITCKELYEYLRIHCPKCVQWEPFRNDPVGGWKLIFNNIGTVNRWFPQPILDCNTEYVKRLL